MKLFSFKINSEMRVNDEKSPLYPSLLLLLPSDLVSGQQQIDFKYKKQIRLDTKMFTSLFMIRQLN